MFILLFKNLLFALSVVTMSILLVRYFEINIAPELQMSTTIRLFLYSGAGYLVISLLQLVS